MQATARNQRMSARQVYADWLQQILKEGDGGAAQPADWQETHSPTEPVEVTISKGTQRTQERCQRRKTDASLWRVIEGENCEHHHRTRAAQQIEKAFKLITSGLGPKVQKYRKGDQGVEADWVDENAALVSFYLRWADAAEHEKGISVSDLLQILAHGETLDDQDKRNRCRYGPARENLLAGLELYADMWRKRMRRNIS